VITQLRNRKPDAYSVIPKIPRYYAFHATTTDLLATIYANDGTWLADRGAIPLPPELYAPAADNGILIPGSSGEGAPSPAPRGWVGVGALAWRSGANELTVWDVANAQLHTYQSTEAANCSPPAVHEGRLFWVEFPAHEGEPDPTEATLTLRHAACDLSDPQTLADVVLSFGVDRWDLGPRAKVAASSGALLVEARWRETINHEASATLGARFPFAVSGATAGGSSLDLEQGFAAADGTSVGMMANENSLRAHSLSLEVPSEARWPTTGPWAFYIATNAAVTTDGTTALLYGGVEEEFNPVVLEAPSTATDGEPAIRVSITSHPVHGIPPILLFFLESV
jgi:hypothetical protein